MFSTFAAIFEALSAIEEELAGGIAEAEREAIIETLISLRKTMDKCVEQWLKFEEKVNRIQERFAIFLPETMPPGFMDDLIIPDGEDAFAFQNSPPPGHITGEGEKLDLLERRLSGIEVEMAITSFRRGWGFWELSMLAEAVSEFQKVIEQQPELAIGHFCLGLASAQMGKMEEAFRELKLLLALDKNITMQGLALNTLGVLLAGQEQYSEALDYFAKATTANPALVEAWFNRGASCYNLKQYPEAVQNFLKAQELLPDDWEIEFYLGKSLFSADRCEEAVNALKRSLRLNPKEPLISFELGLACRRLGKKNRARFYFQTTRRLIECVKR